MNPPLRPPKNSPRIAPAALARPGGRAGEPGWVGKAYSGVTIEVWDRSGNPVRAGVTGEVAVKGPANSTCYLGDPAASAVTFRNGYVLTGDIGFQNQAGDLFVLGRDKPMINAAGKKVSPAEVEACLRSHPSVADALVLGARAPDGDEKVQALVVPAGDVTALALQDFCGRKLAAFKVPRQVVFVKNLSRGAMGKVPDAAAGSAEG